MGPLLETFHALESTSSSSSILLLWTRISCELAVCTQCVCQHHQALHSYDAHYQSDSVGPLLNTLHRLDEERVSAHLNRINAKLRAKQYDPARDGPEVVSLMFEVLMFPVLLDDSSLANEFQIFLEAIDHSYEVTLSTDQQYPVLSLSLLPIYFSYNFLQQPLLSVSSNQSNLN